MSNHSVLLAAHYAHIPDHCYPANDTLRAISDYWRTCIPSYLALTSTLLGSCSIVAWLFAQLPQIYKNFKIRSTAGLSAYFLLVWCLGDTSNLVGALLTGQATWQVIIASYYTFVDFCLVAQYIWYELMGRGRKRRLVFDRSRYIHEATGGDGGGPSGSSERDPLLRSKGNNYTNGSAKTIKENKKATQNGGPEDFVFPALLGPEQQVQQEGATTEEFITEVASSGGRTTTVRTARPTGPSSPPGAMILFACLCIAFGRASPISPEIPFSTASLPDASELPQEKLSETIGRIISWASTVLYLVSRIPQLIKNYRRKSTAGLSPTLFAAAFSGNFFYSSSLLTNPLAWDDYGPYGYGGWVGPEGSSRIEWIVSAIPFFLGAAGVLVMDGAVGIQFLMYGEGRKDRYTPRVPVLVETPPTRIGDGGQGTSTPPRSRMLAVPPGGLHADAQSLQRPGINGGVGGGADPEVERASWRRVSGYMRGWVPSFSPASWSRSGYMASAAAASRGVRDRIAGVMTPRNRSRSRNGSVDRSSSSGSGDSRRERGRVSLRAEAEAWESNHGTRQGSIDDRTEERPLLEGEAQSVTLFN